MQALRPIYKCRHDMILAMNVIALWTGILGLLFAATGLLSGAKQEDLPLRQPVVRTIYPVGGQAGQRIPVEIEGEFLDRAEAIRCECDGLKATIRGATAVRLQVEIELPANIPPGPRIIFVQSPRGTSNRVLFRVTEWSGVTEREPNDTLPEAQRVAAPVVIEGRIARLTDVDFYRFHANAGERLAFNVIAARSKAAGFVAVTLLSGSGRELAHNNARIGPDAYLDYTFKEAGEYAVVVTPRRFADFFTVVKDDQLINWQYQLAVGRSPILWSVFPMGGKRGTSVDAELHADFLAPDAKPLFSGKGVEASLAPTADKCGCKYKLAVRIAEDAQAGMHLLTVPDSSGNSVALGFSVSDGPEILEIPLKPQHVELPVIVNGRIGSPGQRGVFRIKVNQDDEVTFAVDARGLGSRMTDPQLVLIHAGGEIVDSADDRCRKCSSFDSTVRKKELLDPLLTHAFISAAANDADAAGEYDAVLLDNSSRGGEDQTYRLTIRAKRPRLRMGIMARQVNAKMGGAARVPVAISREEGFQEDVQVSPRGLPLGWAAKPLTIAMGHDKGELEIQREDGASLTGQFEIVGNSQFGVLAPILTEDGFGYIEAPETKVTVSFVEGPLFSLKVEEPNGGFAIDSQKEGSVEIPVMVVRATGFDGVLKFKIEDAPEGVTIKAQDATHLWIQADPRQTKAGRYRIALGATGTAQGRESVDVSSGFRLQVK